jgi:restriction endonuclease S subunit
VGQVTIGKLALFRIEQIELPVPPIDLQRQFATRVEAINRWVELGEGWQFVRRTA